MTETATNDFLKFHVKWKRLERRKYTVYDLQIPD